MRVDGDALRAAGFLLIRDFLTREEHRIVLEGCVTLSGIPAAREVVKVENFEETYGSNTTTFLNKLDYVPALKTFAGSQKLKTVADAIFANGAVAHMNLLQVSAGGKGQGIAWHRDTLFRFGAGQMMNFLFFPLGTDAARGGTTVLPGSHRRERVDLEGPFAAADGEVTLFPAARDLLIVDGTCFHRVAHSTSDDDRMSFNVRFRDAKADKTVTRYAEFVAGEADFLPDAKAP